MTDQAEKSPVLLGNAFIAARRKIVPRADIRRRPAMLQAAIAAAWRMQQEQVAIQVRRHAEQGHVLLADRLQVMTQPRHVDAGVATDRDSMGNAAGLEFADSQLTDLDGVIDQLGIVGSDIGAETILPGVLPAHGRRHAPVPADVPVGRLNIHIAGSLFLANDGRKHAGAVKERMCQIEVCAPHAVVVSIDVQHQCQFAVGWCGLPATLVELGHRNIAAVRLRACPDNMSRVVADHVAARNPCRHRENLARRIRVDNGQAHFEQVRSRIERSDGVAMWRSHDVSCRVRAR